MRGFFLTIAVSIKKIWEWIFFFELEKMMHAALFIYLYMSVLAVVSQTWNI